MQQSIKRIYFRWQIKFHRFITNEHEYSLIDKYVKEGDWVLDVGANIGHYTLKLSNIVGQSGRVIAFEPVSETFELLAANVSLFPFKNVTLFNVAASDDFRISGVEMPLFDSGLTNYYMASLATSKYLGRKILCMKVDNIGITEKITFAKIDVEGHELQVLQGMQELLTRDKPVLVVEDNREAVRKYMDDIGYDEKKLEGSSNIIFTPRNI